MALAGKIIGVASERVTVVKVEGYLEYIPLNCQTDGIVVGDSFYKPPNTVDEFYLYKRDSNEVFHQIELYYTDNNGNCTWKWAKPDKFQ